MSKTTKDNKYKDYRSDKARKFNRDEKRKKKHERDALRAGDIEKLINVETETGNTFYSILEKEPEANIKTKEDEQYWADWLDKEDYE